MGEMDRGQPGAGERTPGVQYPTPRVEWIPDWTGSFDYALHELVFDKLVKMAQDGRIVLMGDKHQKPDGTTCRKYVFWIDEDG